jgi:hypothetical protein
MHAGSIELSFHAIKESEWLPLLRLSSEGLKYIGSKTADFGDSAVEATRTLKLNEEASGLNLSKRPT